MTNKKYTVWVGGVEVNDNYITLKEAKEIEKSYIKKGYNDVSIQLVDPNNKEIKQRLDYLELNDDRLDEDERQDRIKEIKNRLNYLRQEIKAERISTQEIAELQTLAEHIDKGDTLLLQWAGVLELEEEETIKLTLKEKELIIKALNNSKEYTTEIDELIGKINPIK